MATRHEFFCPYYIVFWFQNSKMTSKSSIAFFHKQLFWIFCHTKPGTETKHLQTAGARTQQRKTIWNDKEKDKKCKIWGFFFLENFFFFHVYFINSKKIKQRDFIRQLPTIYIITLVFACVLINPDPIYFFTNKIHTNHTISTSWTNCCDLMNSKGHNQNWFPTLCLSSSLLRYVRMIFAFSCWQSSD